MLCGESFSSRSRPFICSHVRTGNCEEVSGRAEPTCSRRVSAFTCVDSLFWLKVCKTLQNTSWPACKDGGLHRTRSSGLSPKETCTAAPFFGILHLTWCSLHIRRAVHWICYSSSSYSTQRPSCPTMAIIFPPVRTHSKTSELRVLQCEGYLPR